MIITFRSESLFHWRYKVSSKFQRAISSCRYRTTLVCYKCFRNCDGMIQRMRKFYCLAMTSVDKIAWTLNASYVGYTVVVRVDPWGQGAMSRCCHFTFLQNQQLFIFFRILTTFGEWPSNDSHQCVTNFITTTGNLQNIQIISLTLKWLRYFPPVGA